MTRRVTVHPGDCVEVLRNRTGPLFDSCVTDPPYHLTTGKAGGTGEASVNLNSPAGRARISTGFMGKEWDGGDVAFRVETWRAIYDQLKPGAHLVAFSGTRTYHRMVVAIEDAGFEIRDQLAWAYGSGFPKSLDVSKAIDKAAGAEREVVGERRRHGGGDAVSGSMAGPLGTASVLDLTAPATPEAAQWEGWGTALKPAWEPICLARKPLVGTVAANVLTHGTGALNIDACRVGTGEDKGVWPITQRRHNDVAFTLQPVETDRTVGRWPANVIHDGSDEVVGAFPSAGGGHHPATRGIGGIGNDGHKGQAGLVERVDGFGSAARFFYSAKAGPLDRLGSEHATVKPVDVMRWLCRLVTPPGGLILDPFGGSGTTGIAAMAEGMRAELVELLPDHVADIEAKLAHLRGEGARIMERHLRRKAQRAATTDREGLLL